MTSIPAGWPTSAADLSRKIYASPDPTVDVLEMMLMLEAAGKAVYEQLAQAVGSPGAAHLILKNSREELGHAHRLAKVLRILSGRVVEIPIASANPYAAPRDFSDVDPAVLRRMADSERGGEALYETWARAVADPEVSRLLRLNASEERGHAARLDAAALLMEAGVPKAVGAVLGQP